MRRSSLYFEIWNKFSLRPPVERKKKKKKKKTSFAPLRVSSDNTSLSPPSFCSQCFFLFKNVHVSILRRPSVLLPNFLLCSFLFIAPIDTRARTSTEHTYVFHATLSLSLEDFSPVLWFFFFLSLLNPLRYSLSFVSALAMKNSTVPTFLLDWHFSWLRLENLQRFRTKSKSVVILESMMEISYNCG